MNSFATKIVLRQFVLWCVLVAAVALLTLLFTVLGTITCAVLTGMMMGASPHRRWQTVPVSLAFPGVVVAMVHAAKVELAGSQQVWLPALCFAAFWVTYLSTRALIRFENRAPSEPRATAKPGQPEDSAAIQNASPAPLREVRLDQLQGSWRCESTGPDGKIRQEIIEVAGDQLLLSVIGPDGQPRSLAAGVVRLKSSIGSTVRIFPATRTAWPAGGSDFRGG